MFNPSPVSHIDYMTHQFRYVITQQYDHAMVHIGFAVIVVNKEVQDYIADIMWEFSRSIAEQLYEGGRRPSFSSNVCDDLTCGYGKLYDWGEWQFPLHPAEAYTKTGNKYHA